MLGQLVSTAIMSQGKWMLFTHTSTHTHTLSTFLKYSAIHLIYLFYSGTCSGNIQEMISTTDFKITYTLEYSIQVKS